MKKSKDWDFPVKKHKDGHGVKVVKPELVHQEEHMSIERLKVPGGWLYITRYWFDDQIAITSSFAPTLFAS